MDVIRGVIMLLMCVDHVRFYLTDATFDATDLSRTTAPLFLTRWITHFCAPGFVLLAGAGAFLRGTRIGKPELARYLAIRGAWLIVLELTVVRLAWTFNFDYRHSMLAGILWMIGWVMIGLAGLVFLPTRIVAAFGLAVVFLHNAVGKLLFDRFGEDGPASMRWLWQILYAGGPVSLGKDGPTLFVLYSFVPWIGVIACGYALGAILTWPDARRRRVCVAVGLVAIVLFVVLRGWNLYGNPGPWKPQPSALFSVLSFVNTRKYPASLLFLLMTLGPTILAIPLAERVRGRLGGFLQVFGRVPLFFYVLHIALAHTAAVLFSLARYGTAIPWLFGNHPVFPPERPEGYGYGLPVVCATTAAVILLLYVPCRRFAARKAEYPGGWLSFF